MPGGKVEEVVVESRQPVVDDELDDVASSYLEWLARKVASPRSKRQSA